MKDCLTYSAANNIEETRLRGEAIWHRDSRIHGKHGKHGGREIKQQTQTKYRLDLLCVEPQPFHVQINVHRVN
jgi:hypothetical protein